ncbi:MAG: DUF4097 domain-containing protein [Acidobacteria bacterium]|nr:DUF4097 domain-containing protein [Acidobacteriota bacterium]
MRLLPRRPAASFSARDSAYMERGRFDAKLLPMDVIQRLMRDTPTPPHTSGPRRSHATAALRASLSLAVFITLGFLFAPHASAQRSFNKEYPAQSNIRLHLHNRSGTIEVLAWKKNVIKVTATMESKSARVTPEVDGDGLRIDVLRENREDVGDINFRIQVPETSTVDINTMRGNITIRNVRGQMVRAHVSSEGDIELTGIRALTVMAENTVGNILFDAELLRGGTYVLNSTQGDIQLRITAEAGFRLMATAPRTRNIELNSFAQQGQFEYFNDKRKVVGKVGDGGAALSTTNGRGSIVFMPR